MRAKPLLLSMVLLTLLALPGIGHMLGLDGGLRTLDMRAPVIVPSLPRTAADWRALPKSLDGYLNDSFGFRPALITAQNALRRSLGAARSPSVLAGKDGWLFFTGEREHDQYIGADRFTPESLERWVAAMEQRQAWLAARGIPMAIVIPPNKHSVYPEMLPDWIRRRAPMTRLDQVMARVAAGSTLQVIDLRPDLQAAKAFAAVYHKQDTHWTAVGAFVGFHRLSRWIAERRPDFQPVPLGELIPIDVPRPRPGVDMDLARMLGLADGASEWLLLKREPSAVRRSEKLMRGRAEVEVIDTRIDRGPSVLLYRDSFGLAMVPYLVESVPRLILAEHLRGGFDPVLVDAYRPDIVVYEIVERLLYEAPINPPALSAIR